MMGISEIKSLANLLRVEEESSSDDDLPRTGYATMGPGDIGKSTKVRIKGNDEPLKNESTPEDPKCIWEISEVPEVPFSDDAIWDPRKKPTYDIVYKQAVRTEDIYLQMNNKTPTTASCECMLITITLEGETKETIDCHVTKTTLDIRSPEYRLNLPLPHEVDPDMCTAEWDSSTSKLTVNLQLQREFDFANF